MVPTTEFRECPTKASKEQTGSGRNMSGNVKSSIKEPDDCRLSSEGNTLQHWHVPWIFGALLRDSERISRLGSFIDTYPISDIVIFA